MNNAKVGYFISPGVLGNYSVTGLGFKPATIKFCVSLNIGNVNNWRTCFGMIDLNGNQNVGFILGGGGNKFLGDNKVDRCIYIVNEIGVIVVQATYVSMDNDGFTLNFSAINTNYTIRWMAIG
jgi:hypothetical protein